MSIGEIRFDTSIICAFVSELFSTLMANTDRAAVKIKFKSINVNFEQATESSITPSCSRFDQIMFFYVEMFY